MRKLTLPRMRTIALALGLVVFSLGIMGQASIPEADRTRLDAAQANYRLELDRAKEIYDRATLRANEKLQRTYQATIKSYEARGDTELAQALQKELDALGGSSDATPGHQKLIQAIGPMVQDASRNRLESSRFANKDYMLIYFSAIWCGPCKNFTPKLVDYVNMRRTDSNFDLLFVSNDQDEASMFRYMTEFKMPWAAIPYSRIDSSGLQAAYGGRGIPNLVLIDREGNVLSASYRNGEYVGPAEVLRDLTQLLNSPSKKS